VGADVAFFANIHTSLGSALFAAGRIDDALPHYEDALELWRKSAGEDDFRVALALANIAEIHLARDEPREALDLYTRSMSLREALVGSEHPALIVPLVGAANAELALGRTEDALLLARRAQGICTGVTVVSPATCANADAALAKVLWSTKGGKKEATRLVRAASRSLESAGVAGSADLARVRAWMESKGIADETSLSPASAAAPR
jgi:tetratricopeptide (TPR) repeat protein